MAARDSVQLLASLEDAVDMGVLTTRGGATPAPQNTTITTTMTTTTTTMTTPNPWHHPPQAQVLRAATTMQKEPQLEVDAVEQGGAQGWEVILPLRVWYRGRGHICLA